MTEQDQDVEHRAGVRSPRRVSRIGAVGIAVAAVVLLVVGGLAAFARDDPRQVISGGANGASETTTTARAEELGSGDTVFVYLNLTATPAEVSGVEAALSTSDAVEKLEFMDRAETYAEFLELFEDQPDFVAAIRPEELPQSFRVSVTGGWDPAEISEWGSLPGVLRVELSDQYRRLVEQGSPGAPPFPTDACEQSANLQPPEGSVPDTIEC